MADVLELQNKIEKLEKANEKAESVVLKYLCHRPHCPAFYDHGKRMVTGPCNCGLEQDLDKVFREWRRKSE